MILIAKMSFWIDNSFKDSIDQALEQFKQHDLVETLKAHVTFDSLPSDKQLLLVFLHNLINKIAWYDPDSNTCAAYPSSIIYRK